MRGKYYDTDSPTLHSVQDPFELYQEKLKAKVARQDQSEEALARRAEKKAKRDKDRTTWLGTNLGDQDTKRKRGDDEEDVAVGKYLAAKKVASSAIPTGAYNFGGQEKKQKKAGGFGDFSGW
jgi:peptidyl-prolyl cis-trans isomerase-like protein 2